MEIQLRGPWGMEEIDAYLQESVYPLRLGCIGKDGFPRVVSVWYHYVDGRFDCATHRSSQLVAMLRDNNRLGFEVAPNDPPYCCVRGQGLVSIHEEGGAEALETLLQRYLGSEESSLGQWLLSRREDELLVSFKPQRLYSWDYRKRMS